MRALLSIWLCVPSRFRLAVYRLMIRLGHKMYGEVQPTCHRLPFGLYAKVGTNITLSEAKAMLYLQFHTTIPVPHVLDIIEAPAPTGVFILMTRLPGKPIRDGLNRMSVEQRKKFYRDMRSSLQQLRAIQQPEHLKGRVCSFSGDGILDYRISSERTGVALESQAAFNDFLFQTVAIDEHPRIREFVKDVHSTNYPLVLTHCDISPFNILVDEDYKLTGILDWETCAWLPAYWEYTRTRFHKSAYLEWLNMTDNILEPWPAELRVEQHLWSYTCNICKPSSWSPSSCHSDLCSIP